MLFEESGIEPAVAEARGYRTVVKKAQPGRGMLRSCDLSVVATTSPLGRARTPLVLEVPMSTPSSNPLNARPR
jgi:hypothetical protein